MTRRAGRKVRERRLRQLHKSLEAQKNYPHGLPILPQNVYRNSSIPGEKNRFHDFYKSTSAKQETASEKELLPEHVYRNNFFSHNSMPETQNHSRDSAVRDSPFSQNVVAEAKGLRENSVSSEDDLGTVRSASGGKIFLRYFDSGDRCYPQDIGGAKRPRDDSIQKAEILSLNSVPDAKRLRQDSVSNDKLPQQCCEPSSLNPISQVGSTFSACTNMLIKNTMTSFGRGRGWACNSNSESVLRRPGRPAQQHSTEISNLITAIDALDINNSVPQAKIQEIVKLCQSALLKESLSSIAEQLFKITLEDRLFGIKLVIPWDCSEFILAKEDESDKTLRSYFLNLMQTEFEKREETRKTSPKTFQNFVSFLGEVFYRFKISGTPLYCLGTPLLTCLSMLLETATIEDIEIIAAQVLMNNVSYHQKKLPQFPEFMNNVREALISRNLCVTSKGLLLLTVEAANQKGTPLPEELQEFYATQVGSRTLMNMQRQYDVQQKNEQYPAESEDKCSSKSDSRFRRRGRREDQKEGLKSDSFFSVEPQRRHRPVTFPNPKHEHDDRFEKDYD